MSRAIFEIDDTATILTKDPPTVYTISYVYDENGKPTIYKGTPRLDSTLLTTSRSGQAGAQEHRSTRYIYDGDRVIAETDDKGNVIAEYVYGQGLDEVLYMIRGGNFYYYHYDGLGNVRAITDSSGNIVETYTYDVYGKPTIYNASGVGIGESQVGNCYFFTGRVFDKTTGLYYYRNRYYDPELGRFITPDPLGPVDDPNLYTYVGNNPVNYVDPYGLCGGKSSGYSTGSSGGGGSSSWGGGGGGGGLISRVCGRGGSAPAPRVEVKPVVTPIAAGPASESTGLIGGTLSETEAELFQRLVDTWSKGSAMGDFVLIEASAAGLVTLGAIITTMGVILSPETGGATAIIMVPVGGVIIGVGIYTAYEGWIYIKESLE